MKFMMGIDVGTTGARAVLLNGKGMVVADAVSDYPMYTPRPGWAEQDPADWARGTHKAIRGVLNKAGAKKGDIICVGLTGQMHSAVFLDKSDDVIRPAMLWSDGRAADECGEITRRIGKKRLLETARNIAMPGFTAPKIVWLKNHEPAAYKRIARILVTKDYIRRLMTGVFATDVSDASGMLLLDVPKRDWSETILEALGIERGWLPVVFESPHITGRVSGEGSKLFGLAEGTPVVGGGGDQAAGAVGNGIIRPGDVAISLGTSGVVFAPSKKPPEATGNTIHAFCHAVPNLWHTMGVMLSAGGSVHWLRRLLRFGKNGKLAFPDMDELADKAPPGCDGLLFLPYLAGERTPHNDPAARGVFFGLSLNHNLSHICRSVLEGVAFGVRDSVELMLSMGVPVKNIHISGGGAASDLWRSIIASVLKKPVKRLAVEHGPATGAAMLAGVGAGVWKNVKKACENTASIKDETKPRKQWVGKYEGAYERFSSLYGAVKKEFKRIK